MLAALFGTFWENTGLMPFLKMPSAQALGSKSGEQARFQASKGCGLSCLVPTDAQG